MDRCVNKPHGFNQWFPTLTSTISWGYVVLQTTTCEFQVTPRGLQPQDWKYCHNGPINTQSMFPFLGNFQQDQRARNCFWPTTDGEMGKISYRLISTCSGPILILLLEESADTDTNPIPPTFLLHYAVGIVSVFMTWRTKWSSASGLAEVSDQTGCGILGVGSSKTVVKKETWSAVLEMLFLHLVFSRV